MTRRGTRTVLGLAAAAMAIAAGGGARVGQACDEDGSGSGSIPYEVYFRGTVDSAEGRRLVVGGATVVIPADPRALQYDDRSCVDPDELFFARVAVGDEVIVDGTLRRDGSILAWWIGGFDPAEDQETPAAVCGICEASDADSFTVGGRRVLLASRDPRVPAFGLNVDPIPYAGATGFLAVQPGDAVAANVEPDAGGNLVGYDDELVLRRNGEGTVLEGTIRGNDEERGLDVDGVTVGFEEDAVVVAPNDPLSEAGERAAMDMDSSYFEDPVMAEGTDAAPQPLGRWVKVTGVLRNGIVIAHRCVVTGRPFEAAPAKRDSRRRPPGRMLMRGAVSASERGQLEVSGLATTTRGRLARRAASLAVGTRVQVRAALRPSGVVATGLSLR